MCAGIALSRNELPTELIERHGLERRAHERRGELEVRFLFRDRVPRLPAWRDSQLRIVRCRDGRGQSRHPPRTGWTWLATVNGGAQRCSDAVPVDIPATVGVERGEWFRVRHGIRGLLVPDEHGIAAAFLICAPAGQYFGIMTRSGRMPVLIDGRI
jgi:hypothetical protein